MPRLVLDYDADIRKVAVKTTQLEGYIDDVMDNVNLGMRRAKAFAEPFTQELQLLGQAFDVAAKEAEKLGRADVATNIREMQAAGEGLLDVLVQVPLGGRDFLQWMGDAAEGATNLAHLIGALGIKFQLMTGMIDQETAVKQLNAMTTDEVAEHDKQLADEKAAATAATKKQTEAEKQFQQLLENAKAYKTYKASVKDAEATLSDLTAQIKKLQAEQGKAVYTQQELAGMALDVRSAVQDEVEAERTRWEAENALKNITAEQEPERQNMINDLERATIAHDRSILAIDAAKQAYEDAKNATVDNSEAIAELNSRKQEEFEKWSQATYQASLYADQLERVRDRTREVIDMGIPEGVGVFRGSGPVAQSNTTNNVGGSSLSIGTINVNSGEDWNRVLDRLKYGF